MTAFKRESPSGKLLKAKTTIKHIYSKFERSIERHERVNKKYIFAKNVARNLKHQILLKAGYLLDESETLNQNSAVSPYGDGLLKQTQLTSKDLIKNLYDDLSLKSTENDNQSSVASLDLTIKNGKRIFSFIDNDESISLDGLAKKIVRTKQHIPSSSTKTFDGVTDKSTASVAANFLLDILSKHQKENNKPVASIDRDTVEDNKIEDEEDIIILTDDIVESSEEEVNYSDIESDNYDKLEDDVSEIDIPVLGDEESDDQDDEIVLSSDDLHQSESNDVDEISISDGVSETSILKNEESFLINDVNNDVEPNVDDVSHEVYLFPLGEHLGEYNKNDIIDVSKYETYVNDFTF